MTYRSALIGVTTAILSVIAVGCAGPATETSGRLADAAGSSSPITQLCGTWQGSYWYIGGDHTTSFGSTDLTLELNGDSTYALKWGSRAPYTGTVAARGNRVVLQDAAGSHITLARSGKTLYGTIRDSVNGRPTMLNLERVESATSRLAATGLGC